MDAGDYLAAVVAYRKYAYLAPDYVVAHLQLGLALEATGDAAAARRAFAAARHAVDHGDGGGVEELGHDRQQLARLLDGKLRPA